ncbi:MAG TPA: tetratricopeptide repeat protein [Bryobacteraceae bacterium]|jgi:tetratricopeptide (TPR) repeat protein|nr:tetratricopeptide repeat protein [Bryobacteraceae bacterium]
MIVLPLLLFLQSDTGRLQFEHANELAQQGHCEQAEPIYRELAQKYPNKPAIPFALGQCQFQAKDYLAAAGSFQAALALDPTASVAAAMRGAALGMAGKMPEALEQLRAATRQDASIEPAFRMLGMFEVESGQSGPEALEALKRAVSLDSSDERAHYWLGQGLLATRDFEEAAAEFEAALRLQRSDPEAELGHAEALRAAGQPERALGEFQSVLQRSPSWGKALLGAARCDYDLQRFPEALRLAEAAHGKVTDLEEKRAAVWLLARLYRAQNEIAKAQQMEAELAAMERDMADRLTHFRMLQEEAARYRTAGDYAKVAATLEQALKIEQRQDSLVVLGDAYRKLGRSKDAAQCYLRALAVGPEQPEITQRLAATRADLGRQSR